MPSVPKAKSGRKSSRASHRSTLSLQKTEIYINVYDLLPPGKLSTILWTLGSGLLHSGVVINDREYAYGGHDHQGLSGVYWTKPRTEPPGGTFRYEILHGFTVRTEEEIAAIIKEVSDVFQGPSYNLLSRNCNHFTSALCEAMTQKAAPGWLNRAASIGVALPCVVPKEWIEPPDCETADGELLDEEDAEEDEGEDHRGSEDNVDEDDDERSRMLRHQKTRQRSLGRAARSRAGSGRRDTSGRMMPVSERAPDLHQHRDGGE